MNNEWNNEQARPDDPVGWGTIEQGTIEQGIMIYGINSKWNQMFPSLLERGKGVRSRLAIE
jgi:hypothetical protein